jgi:methionine synthase II (cobalamin-independent)
LVPDFGYRDEDFQSHYPSEEAFFFALEEAMREEYWAIVDAGFILQIDDPRVVSGWGGRLYPELVWAKFRAMAEGARLATTQPWG